MDVATESLDAASTRIWPPFVSVSLGRFFVSVILEGGCDYFMLYSLVCCEF